MRRLQKICLSSCVLFMIFLAGCQPEPLEDSVVLQDLPVVEETITVGRSERTLSLGECAVTGRETEGKSDAVYCSYELTDGTYSIVGEYCLFYVYEQGAWTMTGANPTTEATVIVADDAVPEEWLAAAAEWEGHFSSEETVTKTEEYQKVSDTQLQASYTVENNGDYKKTSTDYVVRGTLSNWSGSTDMFYWNIEEGEGDTTETWDIVGEYRYESDLDLVIINIDSYDPETNEAHISYAKQIAYAYFPGEEDKVKELSDVTISLERVQPYGVNVRLEGDLEILYYGGIEISSNTFQWNDHIMKRAD